MTDWLLCERDKRLPKWAQKVIQDLRCERVNAEMEACVQADVRRLAKRVFGGNCTFADDDAHMLAAFAEAAIDAGLHKVVADPRTLGDIEQAQARREAERAAIATERAETLGSVHEGAGLKASPNPNPSNTQEHKGGDRG